MAQTEVQPWHRAYPTRNDPNAVRIINVVQPHRCSEGMSDEACLAARRHLDKEITVSNGPGTPLARFKLRQLQGWIPRHHERGKFVTQIDHSHKDMTGPEWSRVEAQLGKYGYSKTDFGNETFYAAGPGSVYRYRKLGGLIKPGWFCEANLPACGREWELGHRISGREKEGYNTQEIEHWGFVIQHADGTIRSLPGQPFMFELRNDDRWHPVPVTTQIELADNVRPS